MLAALPHPIAFFVTSTLPNKHPDAKSYHSWFSHKNPPCLPKKEWEVWLSPVMVLLRRPRAELKRESWQSTNNNQFIDTSNLSLFPKSSPTTWLLAISTHLGNQMSFSRRMSAAKRLLLSRNIHWVSGSIPSKLVMLVPTKDIIEVCYSLACELSLKIGLYWA